MPAFFVEARLANGLWRTDMGSSLLFVPLVFTLFGGFVSELEYRSASLHVCAPDGVLFLPSNFPFLLPFSSHTGVDYVYTKLRVKQAYTWHIYHNRRAEQGDCFRAFNPVSAAAHDAVMRRWSAAILSFAETVVSTSRRRPPSQASGHEHGNFAAESKDASPRTSAAGKSIAIKQSGGIDPESDDSDEDIRQERILTALVELTRRRRWLRGQFARQQEAHKSPNAIAAEALSTLRKRGEISEDEERTLLAGPGFEKWRALETHTRGMTERGFSHLHRYRGASGSQHDVQRGGLVTDILAVLSAAALLLACAVAVLCVRVVLQVPPKRPKRRRFRRPREAPTDPYSPFSLYRGA